MEDGGSGVRNDKFVVEETLQQFIVESKSDAVNVVWV